MLFPNPADYIPDTIPEVPKYIYILKKKKKTNEQITQEGREVKESPTLIEPQREFGFVFS